MSSIYFKEMKAFLGSIAGYVALLSFLIFSGLLLWVFPDTNILDYGYASMDQFFNIVPWLLLFLIPVITMRSFADEFKAGTIEWLSTKPIATSQLVLGKFLASFSLVLIALLPTALYVVSLHYLAMDDAALDLGGILGAYLGVAMLTAAFASIGVFCSCLSDNQIVSFLAALFLCFLLYIGFEALSRVPAFRGGADYYLGIMGMDYHYQRLSRGVIDVKSVVYFASIIIFFLYLTKYKLRQRTVGQ